MKHRYLALLCLTVLTTAPLAGRAEMRPVLKHRAGVPPYSVIAMVMDGNRRSVEEEAKEPPPPEMAPALTWLSDCDHRVHPGLLMKEPAGKVYAVCTLGNQLALATAAIDFGVRQLFSPVLLITGQTDSEAIRFFEARPAELTEAVRHDLAMLELPPPAPKAKTAEKKKATREKSKAAKVKEPPLPVSLVERNVDYQVTQAVARYQDRIASGRLVVVGGVIDLANQYGEGKNRLFLINVNGETDPAKLKKSPHLVRLDPSQLKLVGRRPIPAQPSTLTP